MFGTVQQLAVQASGGLYLPTGAWALQMCTTTLASQLRIWTQISCLQKFFTHQDIYPLFKFPLKEKNADCGCIHFQVYYLEDKGKSLWVWN